ncbi:MAG: ACP S-malonyltransferase [Evtepia sp.]
MDHKIAFVFSGQGAQYSGMGATLTSPAATDVFRRLDAIRPGTSAQCFHGTAEELNTTKNTQPCLFAVELAAAAALSAAGVVPHCIAGFSLGEVSALTGAGVFSLEDGFRLVCRRAELMQTAAEKVDSGMVAVVKLSDEAVEELCGQFEQVYPVNYNCPGQVAVAGRKDVLPDFSKAVKAAGGRAVPLRVSGGFHAPFMDSAAEAFGIALESVPFGTPSCPVYSDYTGLPYEQNVAELLTKQIKNPVRWNNIITHMIENGVDTFIEIGPGETLCGLIKKIDSSVTTRHVADADSLEKTLEELSGT